MIKKLLLIFLSVVIAFALPASAAKSKKTAKKSSIKNQNTVKKEVPSSSPAQNRTTGGAPSAKEEKEFRDALALAKQGNYAEASIRLFSLSLSPRYINKRMQIRYLLGLMLYQLKMYQTAAFQFIGVIRDGNNKYVSQSLEKLSLAANELGDETLLNYAISRVKAESFPAEHKDILFYRIGEFQMRNQQYSEAIRSFDQVPADSPIFDKTVYLKGLTYAQANQVDSAVSTFESIIDSKSTAPVTDTARVAALMGKARSLYQKKEWAAAIATYREVPRDSELWHDTLFESSWAMLRSGQFRSALSNFQSLHSPYYEENYFPESLLLRAIVYLYICQYNEMDKVLTLFSSVYRPVVNKTTDYLKNKNNPSDYFNDVAKTLQAAQRPGFDPSRQSFAIPYIVTQYLTKEGDFQRSFSYIRKLIAERKIARQLPSKWKNSGIGKYTLQTLDRRLQKAKTKAGRQIRSHMIAIRAELIDLFEQEGFVRYEMINAKKETLKQKVAGKDLPGSQIDEDNGRDYYIQNGYQYWTFRGEYWLDELGNYHYVGARGCN